MLVTNLLIAAVMTMGGVEEDGQLNLLFEGVMPNGAQVFIAATFPSESAAPLVDGQVPIFGTKYLVKFSGKCQKSIGVMFCNASTLSLGR